MFHLLSLILLSSLIPSSPYSISIRTKGNKPALSFANPHGQGYSPCKFTFNPGWVPIPPGATDKTKSLMIVRVAQCPTDFGGNGDHLMMTTCSVDGTCEDLQPTILDLEVSAQDPRVSYWQGWYYLFYFANGPGLDTVYLRKTQTPENPKSWQKISVFGWHRNGCMLYRDTPPHYCIFGEAPPLPAIGIATTMDMETFKVVNDNFF